LINKPLRKVEKSLLTNAKGMIKEMYTIVFDNDNDINKFILIINDLIKAGWKPLGGIATSDTKPYLAQAMIKDLP
jgi:hypothetical protein